MLMILKLLRYFILFLILLNLPSWVLVKISPVLSSLLSELSYGLMLLYFLLAKNWRLNGWMLALGVLYFGIGTLVGTTYAPEERQYFIEIIKFFIVIIGGYGVIRDTNKNELFGFIIIGALSVFLQIFYFYNPLTDGGRYSGFYLNPNGLGFVCIMGYGLTYGLDRKWRLIGQIIFTIVGFLTFSRTFIVLWLFTNILSIRLSIKNLKVLAVGFGLFIGLLTFNSFLPTSNARLEAMTKIFEGKSNNTSKLEQDSRTQTWAIYYPALMSSPIWGHGHEAFKGGGMVSAVGTHNTYIKTWGEGGIITLLVMLIFYALLLKNSWSIFLIKPHLFLMTLSLILFMSTNHSYWSGNFLIFFSMWLQYQIRVKINIPNSEQKTRTKLTVQ